jgi:hypothetical protein
MNVVMSVRISVNVKEMSVNSNNILLRNLLGDCLYHQKDMPQKNKHRN